MIKVVDEVAGMFRDITFVAQVSKSTFQAEHLQTFDFIPPVDFNQYFEKADLIISHAGMGCILSALERNKPIIIIPRLAKFEEHRNDHQVAACEVFKTLNYVNVAADEIELKEKLIGLIANGAKPLHHIGRYASDSLLASLTSFITDHK